MADNSTLSALQDLDRILLAALEGRRDDVDFSEDQELFGIFEAELSKLLNPPPRNSDNRNAINSGIVPPACPTPAPKTS